MAFALHGYWRAGAPYRVRIALNLKGLAYDYVSVDLAHGEQQQPAYRALNPQGLTPALVVDNDLILTQSLAIIEWLEETRPNPPLLPRSAEERAVVRAMAAIVACDTHPLNNARVQRELAALGQDEAARNAWSRKWIAAAFDGLEPMIARHGKGFAFGGAPTLADCCLVPQVYGAERVEMDLSPYPAIRSVAEHAATHAAFAAAHPDLQPDAPGVAPATKPA